MQKLFDENGIEPGPQSDTIGVVYRVGELMMKDGDNRLAKDCFSIVYDITQEKAIGGTSFVNYNFENTDSIIFVLDGTMWNSVKPICEAWDIILQKHPEISKKNGDRRRS